MVDYMYNYITCTFMCIMYDNSLHKVAGSNNHSEDNMNLQLVKTCIMCTVHNIVYVWFKTCMIMWCEVAVKIAGEVNMEAYGVDGLKEMSRAVAVKIMNWNVVFDVKIETMTGQNGH